MGRAAGFWKDATVLAVGGAAAFWVTNLALSLTSVAADYRAALSISYVSMVLEALLGGLVIGFGVAAGLLRFSAALPLRSPVAKGVLLSSVALVVLTLLVEVPAKFGATPTTDPWRWLLVGLAFNCLRITALGVVVGHLYGDRDHPGEDVTTGGPRSRHRTEER